MAEKSGNGNTVRFSGKVYSRGAIAESIEAYREFAMFTPVKKDGGYFEVTVDRILEPEYEGKLLDEFKNYVLYMTIAGKKQW